MSTPSQILEMEKTANDLINQLSLPIGEEPAAKQDTVAPPTTDTDTTTAPADTPNDELSKLREELQAANARYQTLQGKFNAELPLERQRTQYYESQLYRQQSETDELKRRLEELEASKTSSPPVTEPEEYATIKETMPEVAASIEFSMKKTEMLARQEAEKVRNDLMRTFEEKMRAMEETTRTVTASTFKNELSSLVPEWQKLNTDPNFNSWLEETDRYTGSKKLDLLRNAAAKGDAVRASTFFSDYLQTTNQSTPTGKSSAPSIDKFTAPPRSSTGTPKTGSTSGITAKYVKEFYDAVGRGDFKGRDEEVNKIERVINEAYRRGEIR